jgi:hypothetical protein
MLLYGAHSTTTMKHEYIAWNANAVVRNSGIDPVMMSAYMGFGRRMLGANVYTRHRVINERQDP